jgi:hypothetical protein
MERIDGIDLHGKIAHAHFLGGVGEHDDRPVIRFATAIHIRTAAARVTIRTVNNVILRCLAEASSLVAVSMNSSVYVPKPIVQSHGTKYINLDTFILAQGSPMFFQGYFCSPISPDFSTFNLFAIFMTSKFPSSFLAAEISSPSRLPSFEIT